jgi:general secretion pathway protein A
MGIYEQYYDCRREPFSLNPDPRFLYMARSHREALAQLRYCVETRKGFAVLTGAVGTGKTTLLRALLDQTQDRVQTGYIFNPPRSIDELYEAIAAELGIDLAETKNRTLRLNLHLLDAFSASRKVVLIFDEAQSISPEILNEIRLLSNLETATAKLIQIILAGQPEFDLVLDSTAQLALRQRVVMRHRLLPLDRDETFEYIANRLRVAGASSSPFTIDACEAVFAHSRGIPRVINLICDNTLLDGYAHDRRRIERRVVENVARELGLVRKPVSTGPVIELKQSMEESGYAPARRWPLHWPWRWRTGLIGLILALCLAGMGLFAWESRPPIKTPKSGSGAVRSPDRPSSAARLAPEQPVRGPGPLFRIRATH